jgi:hypothetical protein
MPRFLPNAAMSQGLYILTKDEQMWNRERIKRKSVGVT